MAEYIKRDAAIREIEQINPVDYGAMWDYEAHHWAGECLRDCKEAIDSIPAADVAPVVHGRWENGNPICPVCGEDKFKDLDADIWCDWQPDFCPNCGAKMDGGADHEDD